MAWTTPITTAVGDPMTAAMWNTYIRDNENALFNYAGGTLGYAQITASQTGITTIADVTGLSVTVTVGTSRRIRVMVSLAVGSTVSTDTIRCRIRNGASADLQIRDVVAGATNNANLELAVVLTPTAGSNTYKVAVERTAGTGTVTVSGSATFPSSIHVMDVGV